MLVDVFPLSGVIMVDLKDMKRQEDEFRAALESFEHSVLTPFVPGELENWMRAVRSTFDELRPLLVRQSDQTHSTDFAQIAIEDPGLLKRVEDMQEEDRQIISELDRFHELMTQLQPRVGAVEPDEAALSEEQQRFVIDGTGLVVRIRKQEVAVRAWLMEAFNRERGDSEGGF